MPGVVLLITLRVFHARRRFWLASIYPETSDFGLWPARLHTKDPRPTGGPYNQVLSASRRAAVCCRPCVPACPPAARRRRLPRCPCMSQERPRGRFLLLAGGLPAGVLTIGKLTTITA